MKYFISITFAFMFLHAFSQDTQHAFLQDTKRTCPEILIKKKLAKERMHQFKTMLSSLPDSAKTSFKSMKCKKDVFINFLESKIGVDDSSGLKIYIAEYNNKLTILKTLIPTLQMNGLKIMVRF